MSGQSIRSLILSTLAIAALGACQPGQDTILTEPVAEGTATDEAGSETAAVASARSVKLVDRDVEAPEVYQVTDEALWDGRPSLGGVWVASPDAVDPERVILRNASNGKFVIGALFRRERDNPGPKLQISSDAAVALGLLAGQPGTISVTALRREEAPTAAPDADKPMLDASETVEPKPLDTAAIATAAIDAAEKQAAADTTAGNSAKGPAVPTAPAPVVPSGKASKTKPTPDTATATPAAPAASGGLIQIGIFSVEANAQRAVDQLATSGIPAQMRKEESQGKAYWSVTAPGNAATLGKIKAAGFSDAYVLKRG